jgi:flagellar hook assembly protein FlgD
VPHHPFRDRTDVNYALPTEGNVSQRVYDATGRTVRTLANGHQKAGSYSVNWDSKDTRGRQVPRGVYFYRLDTPGFRAVKKAVVTR